MEYVIAVLLIIIIYYLYELNKKREEQTGRTQTSRYQKATNRSTFTKEEYDEARKEYVHWQTEYDYASGMAFAPGYPGPWLPPDYDDAKGEIHKLENLRFMAEKLKEEVAEMRTKKA